MINIKQKEKEQAHDFSVSVEDKNAFGLVYTPFSLVERMLDLIPEKYYGRLEGRWLDMGAGVGNFSIYLFNRRFAALANLLNDPGERRAHIIKNLYMSEIKKEHINILREIFGSEANIFGDFLSGEWQSKVGLSSFDFIIGNPPYNIGKIKTPTNKHIDKKSDGISIWSDFIKKALDLLRENGLLCVIIPATCLKEDKAGIFALLCKYRILALHTLTNTETNKIFAYQAQTPTCFFLLQKTLRDEGGGIRVYDKFLKSYAMFGVGDGMSIGRAIPLHGISIINKMRVYVEKYGSLRPIKTMTPSKKSEFSLVYSSDLPYKNIKTSVFGGRGRAGKGRDARLVFNYSNIPQIGYGKKKLVLAHKMYGFPFLDISGIYGISTRDNYVFFAGEGEEGGEEGEDAYSIEDLKKIRDFLSTKLARFIYSACYYRMRYLERYAFDFIPDVGMFAEDFWREGRKIDDTGLSEVFGITEEY